LQKVECCQKRAVMGTTPNYQYLNGVFRDLLDISSHTQLLKLDFDRLDFVVYHLDDNLHNISIKMTLIEST